MVLDKQEKKNTKTKSSPLYTNFLYFNVLSVRLYMLRVLCRQYKTAIKYQTKLYMYFITRILRHKKGQPFGFPFLAT